MDDQTSNSVLHVAASKDNNPLDGWHIYDADVKRGTNWLDYPVLGIDVSTVYNSGNYLSRAQLLRGPYIESGVWAVNKNALESGQTAPAHF